MYRLLTTSILLGLTSGFAFGQGSLTPPEPIFETLQELLPRTPISSLPFTISTSGSYYLTTNLTGVAGSNGITITAGNVTLDLKGFTLTGVSGSFDGVSVIGQRRNVTVCNGVVRNWGDMGINLAAAQGSVLKGIRALNNGTVGLATGSNSVVTSCVALTNGTDGIQVSNGSVIRECIASSNGRNGIVASPDTLVTQCTALRNKHHGLIGIGGCYLLNNMAAENGSGTTNASGIFMAGSGGARVDGNITVNNRNLGMWFQGTDNLIIRNSARGHATNYVIPAGNNFGPTNDISSANSDTNPWQNRSL